MSNSAYQDEAAEERLTPLRISFGGFFLASFVFVTSLMSSNSKEWPSRSAKMEERRERAVVLSRVVVSSCDGCCSVVMI